MSSISGSDNGLAFFMQYGAKDPVPQKNQAKITKAQGELAKLSLGTTLTTTLSSGSGSWSGLDFFMQFGAKDPVPQKKLEGKTSSRAKGEKSKLSSGALATTTMPEPKTPKMNEEDFLPFNPLQEQLKKEALGVLRYTKCDENNKIELRGFEDSNKKMIYTIPDPQIMIRRTPDGGYCIFEKNNPAVQKAFKCDRSK